MKRMKVHGMKNRKPVDYYKQEPNPQGNRHQRRMAAREQKSNVVAPDVGVLAKLGSIAVHVDEMLSDDGHAFDRMALQQLLADADVQQWLKQMDAKALLPKKRK
jgi:hypothetical protein